MNEYEKFISRASGELKIAELLIAHSENNASVSRAYYAMFYAVQALMHKENIKCSSHGGLISTFSKQFVKTGIFPGEVGRSLNDAYDLRQTSDYDVEINISRASAIEALEQSKNFVNMILKYLGHETR